MKDKKTPKPVSPEGRELTYLEAVEDLARIIDAMENDELNMDELSEKVKAATERLNYCQKALHAIEQNVNELMKANARCMAEFEQLSKQEAIITPPNE
ncbi:MAG: exodeoxyribonuclease VII small subunit [Prevotellaceae bacterium]|jgi:exodeoxyribonuclease VII small subunit|nr:exodeoxyribonuclease VII small subunit [Prevotellaceae bacterium]